MVYAKRDPNGKDPSSRPAKTGRCPDRFSLQLFEVRGATLPMKSIFKAAYFRVSHLGDAHDY